MCLGGLHGLVPTNKTCVVLPQAKYDKKMKMVRDDLELRRKQEIHEIEERKVRSRKGRLRGGTWRGGSGGVYERRQSWETCLAWLWVDLDSGRCLEGWRGKPTDP